VGDPGHRELLARQERLPVLAERCREPVKGPEKCFLGFPVAGEVLLAGEHQEVQLRGHGHRVLGMAARLLEQLAEAVLVRLDAYFAELAFEVGDPLGRLRVGDRNLHRHPEERTLPVAELLAQDRCPRP